MSNIELESGQHSRRRYSINQLLQLSQSSCSSFDLSRFSFAAARAGLVPPLGDCATNSRKTSAARSRIPSNEAVTALDGTTASQDSIIRVPERQPQPPKASELHQKENGFARFLKKHSSPTHQRVTAGGRIVPMEAAPPSFSLSARAFDKKTDKPFKTQAETPEVVKAFVDTEFAPLTNPQTITQLRVETCFPAYHHDNLRPPNGFLPVQQPGEQLMNPSMDSSNVGGRVADQYMPIYGTNNVDSFCPSFNPAQQNGYVPWRPSPVTPTLATHAGGAVWPYNDGVPQYWPHSGMSTHDLISHQVKNARESLEIWTNCYNELDQQLKNLDRHRAMTHLNSDIATQRCVLVQHRSDTKDVIDNLKEFLKGHEQLNPAVSLASGPLSFNIDAPVYIPQGGQGGASMPNTTGFSGVKDAAPVFRTATQIRAPVPRRPIPIVPPPKLQTNLPPAPSDEDDSSPDSPTVRDAWGSKLGPPPPLPELHRQQTGAAEPLSTMISRSSFSNQSHDSFRAVPVGGFFGKTAFGGAQGDDTSSSDEDSPRQTRSFFASKSSESLQVQLFLEALQKPASVSTRITLGDGQQINVQGQNLQSPHSSSAFDSRGQLRTNPEPPTWQKTSIAYGFGTPKPVKAISGNRMPSGPLRSYSVWDNSSRGSDKENISARLHQKAATDASWGRFNNSQTQDEPVIDITDPFRLRVKNDGRKISPPFGTSLGAGGMMQPGGREAPLHEQIAPNSGFSYFDRPSASQFYQPEPITTTGSLEWSSEGFANKGYSSVSLQNVHATAQMPQNFDGPIENSSRGAVSMFPFLGKGRSPRYLRHTTTNGGA